MSNAKSSIMENFKTTVQAFNNLVHEFKFAEALDKYYDDDVVSQDNTNEPTKGLANLRKAVDSFVASSGIEKIELLNSIAEDDLSVAHWHYVFTHPKVGKLDYKQISVQRWKNGKIIQENHFYNLGF
ncbi:SnoaL-like domain-containing protein [Chitinophaga terrae (ex Kim and Jung 2007)]|uniref:SnoaL-like domain-containing protein n=2 Tax=Chitinophaga terrae (ex Kim and Jung 2007) TaxID=408074 RepID=A0A1H4D2E3_9BACT|nr:hypothetical protein CTE07_22390 [Chitinophaga terrae (ex Kim and Jung 2007)]SEA66874.1 SnoaL-like domain-containing protein [Chitinophaga terrae (ex Kim and Jung 2007)]